MFYLLQVNTDLNWLQAYAGNPATLSILMLTIIIIVFIWKGLPYLKDFKDKNKNQLEDITNKINENKKLEEKLLIKLDNLAKDTLRNTIYSEKLSVPERLLAARRYFDVRGNGETEKFVKEELINDNEEVWQLIKKFEYEKDYFKPKDKEEDKKNVL
jgi:hypothetical protein